jgi:hypothetical protein
MPKTSGSAYGTARWWDGLSGHSPAKTAPARSAGFGKRFPGQHLFERQHPLPGDWALFRDVTRILMKAMLLVREQGLMNRIPTPESFLSHIEKLPTPAKNTTTNATAKRLCAKWTRWCARCATMPNATGICWRNIGNRRPGLKLRPSRSCGEWTKCSSN